MNVSVRFRCFTRLSMHNTNYLYLRSKKYSLGMEKWLLGYVSEKLRETQHFLLICALQDCFHLAVVVLIKCWYDVFEHLWRHINILRAFSIVITFQFCQIAIQYVGPRMKTTIWYFYKIVTCFSNYLLYFWYYLLNGTLLFRKMSS